MKSAALRERARRTRSPSGINSSSERVIATRYLPRASSSSRKASAKASTTSFSSSPPDPFVPLSMPELAPDRARQAGGHPLRFSAASRSAERMHLGGAICRRDGAHEARAIRSDQIKHETSRLTFGCIEDERLFEAHRSFRIEHDAGAALHDESIAKRFHQAARLLARFGGKLEGCLRQVDHHAIRVGEHESGKVYLPAQIDHEACLLVVPPTPMSVAMESGSAEGAVPRTPFSAATPGPPSSVPASVNAMAMARVFTNPDPLGPF